MAISYKRGTPVPSRPSENHETLALVKTPFSPCIGHTIAPLTSAKTLSDYCVVSTPSQRRSELKEGYISEKGAQLQEQRQNLLVSSPITSELPRKDAFVEGSVDGSAPGGTTEFKTLTDWMNWSRVPV